MDTRQKILRPEQLGSLRRAGARLKVVTGCFDPLLAWHARRLKELRQPGELLLVVVTDPPDPILPATARAELVAALDVVDAVVIAGENLAGLLEALAPDELIREEAAERVRRDELIRLVASRCGQTLG